MFLQNYRGWPGLTGIFLFDSGPGLIQVVRSWSSGWQDRGPRRGPWSTGPPWTKQRGTPSFNQGRPPEIGRPRWPATGAQRRSVGCWRIKVVSTYDPQAYGPTPFSPRDSQGSCQSAEQGDYKCLIYLYSLTTQTLTMIKLEKQLNYTREND
jgi:hypothetical protein